MSRGSNPLVGTKRKGINMFVTLVIVAAASYGSWKAGRKYQAWRSGSGWKEPLRRKIRQDAAKHGRRL
jgi:hypothetical protein